MKCYLTIFIIASIVLSLVSSSRLMMKKMRTAINTHAEIENENNKAVAETSTSNIPYDQWHLIKNVHTQKCLWQASQGGKVQQRNCNPSDKNFWWKFVRSPRKGGNWVGLQHSTGLFFDVVYGGRGNGVKYWLYHLNWSGAQQFRMDNRGGRWAFVNEISNRCLDVPGGNGGEGVEMIQWDCHFGGNQLWEIFRANEGSQPAAAPAPTFSPPLGQVGQIKIRSSGKCLRAKGSRGDVTMEHCNPQDDAQKFKIERNGNYFTISSLDGLKLDLKFAQAHNGNRYWIHPANGHSAQNWKFEQKDGGHFLIVNAGSNKCLDGPWHNLLHQWSCHSGMHQQFSFSPVSSSASAPARTQQSNSGSNIVPTNVLGQITVRSSGKCLRGRGHGGRITVEACNPNDEAQKFKFTRIGNNYRIQGTDGMVFDLHGASPHNGNSYIMYQSHGGNNQNWEIRQKSGRYFLIVSERSNKCLDAPHGNLIHQWDCHAMTHQQFSFTPLSGSGPRPSPAPQRQSSDKEPYQNIKLKGHHQIKNSQGQCLSDSGFGKGYRFTPCNENDDNLFFKFEKQRDGSFVIMSDSGNVMERRRSNIEARRPTSHRAQRWNIREIGGRFLIRTSGKRCLTSENSGRLRPCQNLPNQAFKFEPYEKVYVSKK